MIQYNVDLASYNTFGISVQAKYFVDIQTPDQFTKLMQDPIFHNTQHKLFLGGGSNILLTQDFNGLIIHNSIDTMRIISLDGDRMKVMVGGGVIWHDFVLRAAERGRRGVENLALIPGTVGAAPVQNIGAYGVEVCDVITSVKGFDLSTRDIRALNPIECHFGYRQSAFKEELKDKFFITHVTFQLCKNPSPRLEYKGLERLREDYEGWWTITPLDVVNKIIEIRESKLPDRHQLGTAGSFFRNPVVNRERYEQLLGEYGDLVGREVRAKDDEGWWGMMKDDQGLAEWYEIRRATVEDVEAIDNVRRQSWKETYITLSHEYIDKRFESNYKENIAFLTEYIGEMDKPMYVATYQWEVVGIKYRPWFDEDRKMHRIGAIYILVEHHGKGLGTSLMQISLSGISKDLLLGVEKDNHQAISFYKWLWFVEDASMEDDFVMDDDHSLRTIWMKRIITKPTDNIKLSAAQLIEIAGYPRGTRVGDAGNYDYHALVLVNHGNATGEQVWNFAQEIIGAVKEKFGVMLEAEVNIV